MRSITTVALTSSLSFLALPYALSSSLAAEDPPAASPLTIKGKTGDPISSSGPSQNDQVAIDMALDTLRNCDPEEGDNVDDLLDETENPVTILPFSNGGNPLGVHDHDTIFVDLGEGFTDKNSVAQAAATIAHEADHADTARSECAETDPSTNFDPETATDEEIAAAESAHAQIHIDEFMTLKAIAMCQDFVDADPAGDKLDCAKLAKNQMKVEEHVQSANIARELTDQEPLNFEPVDIDPEGCNCDK